MNAKIGSRLDFHLPEGEAIVFVKHRVINIALS